MALTVNETAPSVRQAGRPLHVQSGKASLAFSSVALRSHIGRRPYPNYNTDAHTQVCGRGGAQAMRGCSDASVQDLRRITTGSGGC